MIIEGVLILGAYILGSIPISALIHQLGQNQLNLNPNSPTQLYFSYSVWVLIFGPLSGILKGVLLILVSDTLLIAYPFMGLACIALLVGAQYSIFQRFKPASYTSLVVLGLFGMTDPVLGLLFALITLSAMALLNNIELGLLSASMVTSLYFVSMGYPVNAWPILLGIILGILIAHHKEFLNCINGNKTTLLDRYKNRHPH